MSLQPGSEGVPIVVGDGGTSSDSATNARLHLLAAWSTTLVGMVSIVVLAILHVQEPSALLVLTGVTGGGGLALAKPGAAS